MTISTASVSRKIDMETLENIAFQRDRGWDLYPREKKLVLLYDGIQEAKKNGSYSRNTIKIAKDFKYELPKVEKKPKGASLTVHEGGIFAGTSVTETPVANELTPSFTQKAVPFSELSQDEQARYRELKNKSASELTKEEKKFLKDTKKAGKNKAADLAAKDQEEKKAAKKANEEARLAKKAEENEAYQARKAVEHEANKAKKAEKEAKRKAEYEARKAQHQIEKAEREAKAAKQKAEKEARRAAQSIVMSTSSTEEVVTGTEKEARKATQSVVELTPSVEKVAKGAKKTAKNPLKAIGNIFKGKSGGKAALVAAVLTGVGVAGKLLYGAVTDDDNVEASQAEPTQNPVVPADTIKVEEQEEETDITVQGQPDEPDAQAPQEPAQNPVVTPVSVVPQGTTPNDSTAVQSENGGDESVETETPNAVTHEENSDDEVAPDETPQLPAHIDANTQLQTGTIIKLEDGYYTVQKGDSIWKIAKNYLQDQGILSPINSEIANEMNRIIEANRQIKNLNLIYPNQKIKIEE